MAPYYYSGADAATVGKGVDTITDVGDLNADRKRRRMKILTFKCEKVHGYLSFSLKFNSDLTFLTGINGSGKTSAVRAMIALLTPSIRDLANMDYEQIAVTVAGESTTTLTARRIEGEIHISCSGVKEALKIPVLRSDVYEPRGRFLERQLDFYREQEAIHAKNQVFLRLEQLPTPMFLDLERRHQVGTRQRHDDEQLRFRHVPSNPFAGSLIESLNDAHALAENTYRQFLARRAQLTDELKQEIILTTFEPSRSASTGSGVVLPSKALMQRIERNQNVVEHSLSEIGISTERISRTVKPFFEHVRDVAERIPTEQALRKSPKEAIKTLQEWAAIDPQLRQSNRLVELINKYNDEVRSAKEPVERYLNSVNGFLVDSGKKLFFDESGNLQVAIREDQRPRAITALSSGERQLVVILTHLAFNQQAKRANVLMIDEPELSLHVRWQELFVEAILNASPDIQLILATHSPSIIKGRLDHCVDVEEARHRDRLFS